MTSRKRGLPAPVFVGGTGRCGTTILGRSLNQHEEVAKLPREPRLVTDPGGIIDLVDSTSHKWGPFRADRALYEFEYIWHEMRSDTNGRYQGHEMEQWIGEEAWERLIEELKEDFVHHTSSGKWLGSAPGRNEIYETDQRHHLDVQRSVRRFMQELFYEVNPDAKYWVDDTPYTVQHLGNLWQIFPGMKMVHIHRHPYEVLASHLRIRFGNKMWVSDDAIANARRIRGIYEGWIRELHSTMDAQEVARDVKLQDVAENPETMMGRILEFMGLDYDPAVAEVWDPDQINTHWERDVGGLSGDEWDKIVEIFEPVAEWYGYEL